MTLEKFKNLLRHDTSLYDLKRYIAGTKRIDYRIAKQKVREELLNVFIPELIAQQMIENAEDMKHWVNAPLFRLAVQQCLQTRRPIGDWIVIARDIIEVKSHSRYKKFLEKQFRAYYHRTKGMEII